MSRMVEAIGRFSGLTSWIYGYDRLCYVNSWRSFSVYWSRVRVLVRVPHLISHREQKDIDETRQQAYQKSCLTHEQSTGLGIA